MHATDDGLLTEEEVALILKTLPTLPAYDKEALLADLEELENKRAVHKARNDFMAFCHFVYPGFKEGAHHRHMQSLLHGVKDGTEKRLTISMPPRHGKSETVAYLFVAWFFGHFPREPVMMITHTADLSADFGRRVRNLIETPVYQKVFPGTRVARDKSSASNWATTVGGKYLAIGIGANVAGHGATLIVADDLVSEQAVLAGDPDKAFAEAWEYVQVGPLQRLHPGGRVVMIGTRWGVKDPIGRALAWADNNPDSPPWHEVRFPALLPSGKALWPEQWSAEELLTKKASMFPQFWAAQYMQEPSSEEGALVKREWWKVWPHGKPPECEYILQSWDTAHETKTASDPSGVQTWGIFYNEEAKQDHIILLDAWTGRKEFPDLKKFCLEYYAEWEPDSVIVEKKAAGAPLIQELRRVGVPVAEFTPSRGQDKRVRLNSVTDFFHSGMVWCPDTRWAKEVQDEVAAFPNAAHDEMVDCVVGDTLIQTKRGLIPVREVQETDWVLSHLGWREVETAVCTGVREVFVIETLYGALTCTANHPIHTQRGWVLPTDLKRTDTIDFLSTEKASLWLSSNIAQTVQQLFSTDTHTRSIPSAPILSALAGDTFCTVTSGLRTTGRYLQSTTSTIKTAIKRTTASTTWSCCLQAITLGSTRSITQPSMHQRHGMRIWPQSALLRLRGTARSKVRNGIRNTPQSPSGSPVSLRHTQKASLLPVFVSNAIQYLKAAIQNVSGFAACDAKVGTRMHENEQQSWRKTTFVKVAELCSIRYKRKPSSAVVGAEVLSVTPSGRQPVFNLAVREAHTFYANGFLTHNCLSQALIKFRQGGFIRMKTDAGYSEDQKFRPRRAKYY